MGLFKRYEAQLVILGNTQVEGTDFVETSIPVVKLVNILSFLAVRVAKGLEITPNGCL